jgi:hypothetical protein
MKKRAKIFTVLVVVSVSILAWGFRVAQAQGNAGPSGGAAVTGTVAGTVPMSVEGMELEAKKYRDGIVEFARQVQSMLQTAQDEGDAVKVDCLDEKLQAIRKRESAVNERLPRLKNSIMVKNTEEADTFYKVIQSHWEGAEKSRKEADSCIGSDMGLLGEAKTTTTVDPDIPEDSGGPPFILDVPSLGLDMPPATDPSAAL